MVSVNGAAEVAQPPLGAAAEYPRESLMYHSLKREFFIEWALSLYASSTQPTPEPAYARDD